MRLTPYIVAKLAQRWVMRKVRRATQPHGFILMYHSIASPEVDPWNISVSPENFAGHMQALSEIADVVPLAELPGRLRKGRKNRAIGSVTFDDAYLDNLTAAKPVLDSLDIPATVFVPTSWVGDPRPMWWERLAHALLAPQQLPTTLQFHEQGFDFSWHEPEVNAPGKRGRRARDRLHRAFWSTMRKLPDDDARHAVLNVLVERLGTNEAPVADARAMSPAELRRLISCGRIEVGSHSLTHPTLPSLDRAQKEREISHSAEQCRELLGERPQAFAYPYGDLDHESVQLVRASGYSVACSTREDLMWEGDDPHLLPRIAVGNWSEGEFRKRLGWYWLA